MHINELQYGNPDRNHFYYLNKTTYLDTLLPELQSFPFPANDSEETKAEIQELINTTNQLADNEELVRRFDLYDNSFEKYMVEILAQSGIPFGDVDVLLQSIKDDIKPLLVKLKYHYQRVRPYQLSKMLGMELISFKSTAADSPSYPSGHAFQSRVYAEVIGNQYPKYHKALHDLATDIMWSRVFMGVHYLSDSQFSDYVASVVCNHPEFKKKYKL
ncbi:MAG: hypothetical protein FJZ56_02730 [Chlamydiae bacterium]|nr:hypothetical protein [Chlamydiota bacterium]